VNEEDNDNDDACLAAGFTFDNELKSFSAALKARYPHGYSAVAEASVDVYEQVSNVPVGGRRLTFWSLC
jgi:hypothetical protein